MDKYLGFTRDKSFDPDCEYQQLTGVYKFIIDGDEVEVMEYENGCGGYDYSISNTHYGTWDGMSIWNEGDIASKVLEVWK